MSLYAFLLFLLPLCQAIFIQPNSRREDAHNKRSRRSKQLMDIGNAAVSAILKGAEKSKIQREGFTIYEKKGSKFTAYRDFINAVSDRNGLMRYTNLLGQRAVLGGAGDRLMYFIPKDIPFGSRPTLTIHDPKRTWSDNSESSIDKIIYE